MCAPNDFNNPYKYKYYISQLETRIADRCLARYFKHFYDYEWNCVYFSQYIEDLDDQCFKNYDNRDHSKYRLIIGAVKIN